MIRQMLWDLRDLGSKDIHLLGYIEQDEYAWILKETDVGIATKGDGYDL